MNFIALRPTPINDPSTPAIYRPKLRENAALPYAVRVLRRRYRVSITVARLVAEQAGMSGFGGAR